MTTKRGLIAVAIVGLWIAGMVVMSRRNANRSEAQQLAEVALKLQPATFYYTVERDGLQIGAASSALDTTSQNLVSEEYFVGDFPVPGGKTERTSARWQTRLTRGFRLVGFSIDVARPTRPFTINASVAEDTILNIGTKRPARHLPARYTFVPPLFTPSLATVVFMLGGPAEAGRRQSVSVFDPTTRTVIRPALTITSDSLFFVVDSAALDNAGGWMPAHRDTVRAWRVEGAPHGLTAWVDSEGRVVTASVGSLSATRTAFEIAFKNPKSR